MVAADLITAVRDLRLARLTAQPSPLLCLEASAAATGLRNTRAWRPPRWRVPREAQNECGCRSTSATSVRDVQFSRELRNDVLAGDITLSVRLWTRPQVKEGGR